MNDEQHDLLRLKMRVFALEMLVAEMYRRLMPGDQRETMRAYLEQTTGALSVSGVGPEWSDLMTSEFHEALASLLSYVELKPPHGR